MEPSLADSKPAEATEAVEVPWICWESVRNAHNSEVQKNDVFGCFLLILAHVCVIDLLVPKEFNPQNKCIHDM